MIKVEQCKIKLYSRNLILLDYSIEKEHKINSLSSATCCSKMIKFRWKKTFSEDSRYDLKFHKHLF